MDKETVLNDNANDDKIRDAAEFVSVSLRFHPGNPIAIGVLVGFAKAQRASALREAADHYETICGYDKFGQAKQLRARADELETGL